MTKKISVHILSTALIQSGKELLMMPIWWYTSGLVLALSMTKNSISNMVDFFGLRIWIKNLFVPMYGETTISGKIISFFVRLFMILVQSMGVILLSLLIVVAFFIYLIFLPIVAFLLLNNTFGFIF